MNKQVLGFVLISVAVVLGFLGLGFSEAPYGTTGLSWFQMAMVFPINTSVDCSTFSNQTREAVCRGWTPTIATGSAAPNLRSKTLFSVPVRIFFPAVLAVAFVGLGLIVFGRPTTTAR